MKNHSYRVLLFLFIGLSNLILSQQSFEEWRQLRDQGIEAFTDEQNNYNENITRAYEQYIERENLEFENYKERIERKWGEFKGSTPKKHVEYSEDLNGRSSVDFESGKVEVEVLIEDPDSKGRSESSQLAEDKLKKQIEELISKESKENKLALKDQIATKKGQIVNKDNAQEFSKEVVSDASLKTSKVRSKDGKKRVVYTVTFNLLPDHIETRAKQFRNDILNQSKRFKVDPALVMAIMHTESNFNPKARSPVPAYGLMQLVPKTGARDAYLFVYGKDKLLNADYLFTPKNNIELGVGYIKKVRSIYFSKIKDEKSALFCTIAAYNTGAGNVAKAFTKKKKLGPAIERINTLSAEQVYEKLTKDLPYKETKKYLSKVSERYEDYKEANDGQ